MSQTKINCRSCKRNLVIEHHSGAIKFAFNAVRSFDPAGPHGPALVLVCECGSTRHFDLPPSPGAVKEIAVKQ